MSNMVVYCVNPIDDWKGWQEPYPLFAEDEDDYNTTLTPTKWKPLWDKAQRLALRVGWEGDIRDGPFVTIIPGSMFMHSGEPLAIIGWKQDNNGTTFLASPFRLPWIEDDTSTEMVEEESNLV